MKDKILSALRKIRSDRTEISEIFAAQGEFYFKFRGRSFSVNSVNGRSSFFIYPRYSGSLRDLAGGLDAGFDDPQYLFLRIEDNEFPDCGADDLYEWLQAKHSGIDDVLRDIGA